MAFALLGGPIIRPPSADSLSSAETLTGLFLNGDRRHHIADSDLEHDVHPALNVTEQVVKLLQLLAVVNGADEELAAIGVGARIGHGHRAGRVLAGHRLVVELVAGPTRAIALGVAALNYEVGFDAVKLEAVVELVAGQEDEGVDGGWGQLGVEAEDDVALGCLDRYQEMVRGIDGHRWRRAETLLTGVAGGRREGRAEVQRTAGRRHAGAWARGWRGARGAAGIASNIDREREDNGGGRRPPRR